MKAKNHYIELEEGLILMGYGLSREKAFKLMNTFAKRNWGDELGCDETDIEPITELTSVQKDYGEIEYSWKSKSREPSDQRTIGWAITF